MGNTVVKKISPSSSHIDLHIQNNTIDTNNREKNTLVKYVTCLDKTSNIDVLSKTSNIDKNSININNLPLFIECPNCHTHVNYICFHTWKHDSKSRTCLHCNYSGLYRDSE